MWVNGCVGGIAVFRPAILFPQQHRCIMTEESWNDSGPGRAPKNHFPESLGLDISRHHTTPPAKNSSIAIGAISCFFFWNFPLFVSQKNNFPKISKIKNHCYRWFYRSSLQQRFSACVCASFPLLRSKITIRNAKKSEVKGKVQKKISPQAERTYFFFQWSKVVFFHRSHPHNTPTHSTYQHINPST